MPEHQTIGWKELDKAILRSQGRTWDGMPIPKLKAVDLDSNAIKTFKEKAISSGRLTVDELKADDPILLENLHLIDEDGHLVRAAMLAFYNDPGLRKFGRLAPSTMPLCQNTTLGLRESWCFARHATDIWSCFLGREIIRSFQMSE